MRKTFLSLFTWAIGLWVVYALGALVFINTPIFGQIVRLEPDARITVGRGWSLLPGRITVWNARIEGEDQNVHWFVDIERADIELHLGDLFRKQFHTRSVAASHVKFRLHIKTPAEKQATASVFGDHWPQDLSQEAIDLKRRDRVREKMAAHWKVRLENVQVASIERLQVEALKLEQSIAVEGRLDLWPGVWAEIGPIAMHAGGSRFSVGENEVARFDNLEERVHIDPFFTEFKSTVEVMDGLTVRADAAGHLTTGALVGMEMLRLEGPEPARFRLEARVAHGQVLESSRLKVSLPVARLRLGGLNLNATGQVEFRGLHMDARLRELALVRAKDGRPVVEGRNAGFQAFTAKTRLVEAGSGWNWKADLRGAHVVDLQPAAQSIARGFASLTVTEGQATLDANASSYGAGRVNLQVARAVGTLRGKPFTGRGSFVARLGQMRLSPLSGSLTSSHFRMDSGDWWATAEVPQASVRMSEKGTYAQGSVRLTLKDSKPFMDLYSLGKKVPLIAQRLLADKQVTGSSEISVHEELVAFRELKLEAGQVRVTGDLTVDGREEPGRREGRFVMHLGLLPVGIRLNQLEAQVRLFPSEEWLASGP